MSGAEKGHDAGHTDEPFMDLIFGWRSGSPLR
jgi:hypothetical protein